MKHSSQSVGFTRWGWWEPKLIFVGLALGSILMLGPLVWMVLSSFKPLAEITLFPPTWIPRNPTWRNYTEVLTRIRFFDYYINSTLITLATVGCTIITSTLAGFAFAKYDLPGGELLFVLVLSMMMLPFHIRLLPMYILMRDLSLVDTFTGIALPSLVSPFGIFLLRQFIMGVPDSLLEAAELDGCSEVGKYLRVVLPLVKPAIAALTIFTFRWSWNDLLWPMVISNSPATRTLPVGMAMFTQEHVTAYHLQMAGATLVILPIVVVFMLMKRQFIEGIALTGMKG